MKTIVNIKKFHFFVLDFKKVGNLHNVITSIVWNMSNVVAVGQVQWDLKHPNIRRSSSGSKVAVGQVHLGLDA